MHIEMRIHKRFYLILEKKNEAQRHLGDLYKNKQINLCVTYIKTKRRHAWRLYEKNDKFI